MAGEAIETYLSLRDPSLHDQMVDELFSNRKQQREPEQELLVAILRDALDSLSINVGVKVRRVVKSDARKWFESTDDSWPFAFEAICDALNLDASAVRKRALSGDVATRPAHRRRIGSG